MPALMGRPLVFLVLMSLVLVSSEVDVHHDRDGSCSVWLDGGCREDVCKEPNVMEVLEHIPPKDCLVELATSPFASFKAEGPGFGENSCEGLLFARLSRLQATSDCSQVPSLCVSLRSALAASAAARAESSELQRNREKQTCSA